jgi:hypothetical protein
LIIPAARRCQAADALVVSAANPGNWTTRLRINPCLHEMCNGKRMTDDVHASRGIDEGLIEIVTEICGTRIKPDTGLLASGLTSADLVALIDAAADRWQVDIPVEILFERGDLIGLAQYIRSAQRQPAAPAGRPPGVACAEIDDARTADRRTLRRRIRSAVRNVRD